MKMKMNPLRWLAGLAIACSAAVSLPALAQGAAPVKVEGAWTRATVPGQSGTGAFMTLTATEPLSLVGVASPVAGVAEVHEMKMEGDIMRMRAIPKLDLPAGKTVELKPGGYHVMLMDLKAPLALGTSVPITLLLRNAQGVESRQEVMVPVTTSAPAAHGMHKH